VQDVGVSHADAFEPDRWLEDGDTVTVGEQTLQVLHCPGHTPGHVVFLHQAQNVAWVGDVLFQAQLVGPTFQWAITKTWLPVFVANFSLWGITSRLFQDMGLHPPLARSVAAIPLFRIPAMDDMPEDREALLRKEYHSQTARINWHDLQTYYAHGNAISVGSDLNLVEVAVQLGLDNTDQFSSGLQTARSLQCTMIRHWSGTK